MALALPPIGWLVIIGWTVLMIFAIATADAVQNPKTHTQSRLASFSPDEACGYQVIEASIDEGVCLRPSIVRPHSVGTLRRTPVRVTNAAQMSLSAE